MLAPIYQTTRCHKTNDFDNVSRRLNVKPHIDPSLVALKPLSLGRIASDDVTGGKGLKWKCVSLTEYVIAALSWETDTV
jgi:hypothetical protein